MKFLYTRLLIVHDDDFHDNCILVLLKLSENTLNYIFHTHSSLLSTNAIVIKFS